MGRCDERFTGYGANKAACLFELYLSGVNFYVMSDHFLIHQSHKYEEEARREEVKPSVTDVFFFWGGELTLTIATYSEKVQSQVVCGFQRRDVPPVGLVDKFLFFVKSQLTVGAMH